MYQGDILYESTFADFESEYLTHSFYCCYDLPYCRQQQDSFTALLHELATRRRLNSGRYLNWTECFLAGISGGDFSFSARLLHFIIDLSRLNAWVEELYRKYRFEEKIIRDIMVLNYVPNKFNEYMVRYYYYRSLMEKYAQLSVLEKEILQKEKNMELRNPFCDCRTLQRVAADLHLPY